jgi:AcrR family transcriptional regulator
VSTEGPKATRRLGREERRAQLVAAAARSFVQAGFAATSLDDVASAAGVTKAIIYRHFESKHDLYLAVLLDTRRRIRDHVPDPQLDPGTVAELALAAREAPDGFRLLYRHARREPEFAGYVDELDTSAAHAAEARLRERVPDPARRRWIAALVAAVIFDAILTWLDTDQPVEPDELARTLQALVRALTTVHGPLGETATS